MKKKVLIIANFMRLPWEGGNSRFPYITKLLNREKTNVEIITTSFSHSEKEQRRVTEVNKNSSDYKITLLD